MQNKKKLSTANGFNLLSVIIIIFAASIISAITTGVIVNNSYKNKDGVSYKEIIEDENLKEFLSVYSTVVSEYYEDINKAEMVETALNAMLDYLGDSYTLYLDEQKASSLAEKLVGTYKGIGITIQGQKIIGVAKDSPAEKAGIQINDEIVMVENEDVTQLSSDNIVQLIQDKSTNKINISIKRNEEIKNYNIELTDLFVPAINHDLQEDTKIGYIYISIFSNTVFDQIKSAIEELESKGMEKLIIDVRNNTGGYLNQAEQIASLFLKENKLIYSLKNKSGKKDYKDTTEEFRTYPIVVLINNDSASASEILATALKDSYGATIVGTTSYGKGKVQQTVTLKDNSLAKYTSAKWLRPNGECVDGVGINPDVYVEIEYAKDEDGNIISAKDTQLEKAIELLK